MINNQNQVVSNRFKREACYAGGIGDGVADLLIDVASSETCIKNNIVVRNRIAKIFGRINQSLGEHRIMIIRTSNADFFGDGLPAREIKAGNKVTKLT